MNITNVEELVQGLQLSSEQKAHLLNQLKSGGPTKEFLDQLEEVLKAEKSALETENDNEDTEFREKVNAELDAAEAEYELQIAKAETELEQATQQFQKDLDAADAEDARNKIAQS